MRVHKCPRSARGAVTNERKTVMERNEVIAVGKSCWSLARPPDHGSIFVFCNLSFCASHSVVCGLSISIADAHTIRAEMSNGNNGQTETMNWPKSNRLSDIRINTIFLCMQSASECIITRTQTLFANTAIPIEESDCMLVAGTAVMQP